MSHGVIHLKECPVCNYPSPFMKRIVASLEALGVRVPLPEHVTRIYRSGNRLVFEYDRLT